MTTTPVQSVRPRERLSDLALGLRVFILLVIGAGAGVLVLSALEFRLDRPAVVGPMIAFALLTSSVKVRLPLKRDVSTMSVSNALAFAAMLLLGHASAVIVNSVAAWGQCTFRIRSRNPWHRTAFSVATLSLSAYAAALVFDWSMGLAVHADGNARHEALETLGAGAMLGALMAAALVYFVVNTGLVAGAVALTARQPVHRVWVDGFMWSAPGYFVAAAAGFGALFVDRFSQAWGVLLAVPIYLTYRSYRMFVGTIEEERAQVRTLADVQLATIEALALAIEVKDQTSQAHIRRFQVYAEGLARAVNLEDDELRAIKTAALLHDIGNLAVPEHILNKPGPLTDEEFRRLQVHPRVGADIVASVPFPYPVAPLILGHHEHWDGNGYPSGLKGEQIPLGARVLAVVDFFTALLADRPYRKALPIAEAIAQTRANAGRALDPKLVERFVAILPELEQRVRETLTATVSRRQTGEIEVVQTESALQDIAGTQRESKVLYEIAQALGSSLGLDDTFTLLAKKLGDLITFCSCALFLRQEDGRLVCQRATGIGDAALLRTPPVPFEQLPTTAGPPGSPVRFTDGLFAPLVQGDIIVGAIGVFNVGGVRFGPDDRRLLDMVANHASGVVQNALLFERTQQASLTDPLTGLANRRALSGELATLRGPDGSPARVALLLMDMDGLKFFNDTYGHHVGDRAIREVASVLRGHSRVHDFCARFAGDEFVVVLRGCTLDEAVVRGRELQDAVASVTVEVEDSRRVPLAISVGAAACPDDAVTQEGLLDIADGRMYQNKSERKGGRAYSAPGLDAA